MAISILTARRIASVALVFFSIVVLGLSAHVETSVSNPLTIPQTYPHGTRLMASFRFTGPYVRPIHQELHPRMLHRRPHHRGRSRIRPHPMEETDVDPEHGDFLPRNLGLLAR
jgi:hypothetical protein